MLVLSRKKNERILFRNLGIEVEILRLARNSVGVGIRAPRSVEILRGELAGDTVSNTADDGAPVVDAQLQHTLRNQLQKAQLTVAIAQKQLKIGRPEEAEATLQQMIDRLNDVDQEMDSSSSLSDPAAGAVDSVGNPYSGRHALVVEDDPNERTLLAGYLRLCGFRVSEAGDGLEAIRALESQDIDLVVLDMRMPRMDGAETIRRIRRDPRLNGTRVVIVSAEDRDESMVTRDDRGVSEWLSKPLDPARLVSHLSDHNSQPAARPK